MKTNTLLLWSIALVAAFVLTWCSLSEKQKQVNAPLPEKTVNKLQVDEDILTSSNKAMETTRKSHLAKAQLYRWYQLYEEILSDERIANQMDILADDIRIESTTWVHQWKEWYPARVEIYKWRKNAHHIQKIDLEQWDNDTLLLTANIVYQNILPDGSNNSYALDYSTVLIERKWDLPLFKEIVISPTGEKVAVEFIDAYAKNRVTGLMHYWIANMETLDGNAEPFKELLTDEFVLNFSTTSQLNSWEKFETWVETVPTTLLASNHIAENLEVVTLDENKYQVTVEFDWTGEWKDNNKYEWRTKHIRTVIDNPEERFARIQQADVEQIIPMAPVK